MNQKATVLGIILVLLVAMDGQVLGEQEQWLGYRTAGETYEILGSIYSQNLKLTTDSPEGLELPKFAGADPLFAKWNTPMSKSPVWIALDRSSAKGEYDHLYIDSDLDGSLADETGIKATYTQKRDDYYHAEFKLVRVLLPAEDGPVAYHLNVTYRNSRGNKNMFSMAGGWYEGAVTVGGEKLWCTLIDNNANGRFGESSTDRFQCDQIRIARKADRSFRQRETDRTTRFVGRHIQVGEKLYELEIAPDGAYVKFTPPGEVPTGTIQVGETVNAFSVFGEQGHFFRDAKDGAADVPVGKYMIDKYEVTRKDKSGALWKISDTGAGGEKPFTVEAGKTTTLDIGGPFLCNLTVSKSGNQYSINQSIRTQKGRNLSYTRNGSRPPAPRVRITSADGSYDRKFRLEYG